VLFIFFTAEEEGLVGSDYYVRHPVIPLGDVVAMLNLDMVGRLKDNSLLVGGAATAPMFDSMVQSAVRGTPLVTSVALPDEGGRGGLGPSDHMSFAMHKIPVLFLFTGMHADYHRPTDTSDKINYDGIDTVVGVSQRIVGMMTTMPRQQYDARSDSSAMSRMFGGGSPHQVVLGVVPNDNAMDVTNGVPIGTVVKDGPADRAGIRANDLLTAFNGKAVHNLSDLSAALDESQAGDKVTVRVLRGSTALELHAVLEAR
jgi:membrane-associated protease RseP (regulator of RpoE activity)